MLSKSTHSCFTFSFPCAQYQLSGSEDHSQLDELGSVVAQLRERMNELDRAVTAISNAGKISMKHL